jgi:hypothetical protein
VALIVPVSDEGWAAICWFARAMSSGGSICTPGGAATGMQITSSDVAKGQAPERTAIGNTLEREGQVA